MFQARSFASSEGEGLGGLEAPAPAPGPSGGGCCGCFGGARGAADGAAEQPAPAFDYDDYLLLEYKWDGPKELTPIEEELETEWVLGQTLRAGTGENACFVSLRRGGEAESAAVKVVGIQGITGDGAGRSPHADLAGEPRRGQPAGQRHGPAAAEEPDREAPDPGPGGLRLALPPPRRHHPHARVPPPVLRRGGFGGHSRREVCAAAAGGRVGWLGAS